METLYLFTIITNKTTGQVSPFNTKVSEEQSAKMLVEGGYRGFLIASIVELACRSLGIAPAECSYEVKKPQGAAYERYLLSLTELPPEMLESTIIDLTGPEFQRQ